MTGTPRATASLIAPVTLPASEQDMRTAFAPSLTAWAMRCAWIWPSSWGGVSHMISIGTPVRPVRSLAAVSAPRRAERKTGLVELFAIIAIRIGFAPGVGGTSPPVPSPVAVGTGFDRGHPAPTTAASSRTPPEQRKARRAARIMSLFLSLREAARREARAGLIEDDRDHDGTADDDPFVILVEMQRPDRLSNENDEDGSEHRVHRASPTAAQTSTANDRGGDHV